MTKDQLFVKLANFLRRNVSLVADATDSNGPWNLLTQLDRYEEQARKTKARKDV
jgi:hypothetical protein